MNCTLHPVYAECSTRRARGRAPLVPASSHLFLFQLSDFRSCPKFFVCCIPVHFLFNSFIYRIYAFRPGWQGLTLSSSQFFFRLPTSSLKPQGSSFQTLTHSRRPVLPLPFVFTTIQTAHPQLPCFHNHLRCRGVGAQAASPSADFSAIPPRTQRLCVIFSASRFSPLSLAHAQHGWPVYAVRLGNGHEVHFPA